MKRILFDQGLPPKAAVLLRERGWDAVHVWEVEMHEAADQTIIDRAARDSRVVVTLDKDFPQILALSRAVRPSLVIIRQQNLKGPEVASLLLAVWEEHEAALDSGCLIKVNAKGTKVRPLPLR